MKKSLSLVCTVAIIGVFLHGCGSTTAKFAYPHDMNALIKVADVPVYKKMVAIMPFDDYRPTQNQLGTAMLSLVPLVPYGWIELQRPDTAGFVFTPSEDLAKAAAVSLRQSNLFNEAFFTFGDNDKKADLYLTGKIISTHHISRIITYGLSEVGTIFWLLGAPVGNDENHLTLTLILKDNKGKIIWEYTFKQCYKRWFGPYYNTNPDSKSFAVLMQQCMNEAIVDLNKKIKENPNLLK